MITRKTVKKTVYFIYRIQRLPTCLECSSLLTRHTHALLCPSLLLRTVTRLEVEKEVENEVENEVVGLKVAGVVVMRRKKREERRERKKKERRGRECGEEEEGMGEG